MSIIEASDRLNQDNIILNYPDNNRHTSELTRGQAGKGGFLPAVATGLPPASQYWECG
jgi:hypothetical protein